MKKTIIVLFVFIFLIGCGGKEIISKAGASYTGTWERQGTYVSGDLVSSASATMELTKTTFNSYTDVCKNSGSIEIQGNVMVMTVEKSDCPSIVTVGSVVRSTFSVAEGKLTLINNEYGAEVEEIYTR